LKAGKQVLRETRLNSSSTQKQAPCQLFIQLIMAAYLNSYKTDIAAAAVATGPHAQQTITQTQYLHIIPALMFPDTWVPPVGHHQKKPGTTSISSRSAPRTAS
jgi:diadenosine tetraphosphate (Ap4A) HIT family hydrolase